MRLESGRLDALNTRSNESPESILWLVCMSSSLKVDPQRVVRCGGACMLILFLISLAARSTLKHACNDGKWSGAHSRGVVSGGRPQGAAGQGGGCAAHAGSARQGASTAGRTSECAPACAGVQHLSRGVTALKGVLLSAPMHVLCLYRYPSAPAVPLRYAGQPGPSVVVVRKCGPRKTPYVPSEAQWICSGRLPCA